MSDGPSDPIATGYDTFYSVWGQSPTLRRIWREAVTGDDHPEDFAHISFLRLAELRRLADALELATGRLLVDLACGAGGPGLWVARHTGATLIGVDQSAVGVERARESAEAVGMASRATFRRGTFASSGLERGSADAVMTVDALQYAPDKAAALREMARILRPGGRLAFVAFALDADRIAGLDVWDDPIGDYRPLLDDVGFDVTEYEDLPAWREQVRAGFAAVIREKVALEREMGPAAAGLELEASITLQLEPYCGHVYASATRR